MPDLKDITRRLIDFRDKRDWKSFHSLKNLIISVSLEAAELLELTQWKSEKEIENLVLDPKFRTKLQEECADVFLYLLLVANRANFDLAEAADRKIEVNSDKYPVNLAKGTALKYTEF